LPPLYFDMENAVPLKTILLIIIVSIFFVAMSVIFAKRSINRYAKKNRGFHTAIGAKSPKNLSNVIEERLRRIEFIKYEPPLLNTQMFYYEADIVDYQFYYRMLTIDSLSVLDDALLKYDPHLKRTVGHHTLRTFLIEKRNSGPLEGIDMDKIDKLTELYDHARHNPTEFNKDQYHEFLEYLRILIEHIKHKTKLKLKASKDFHNASSSNSGTKSSTEELHVTDDVKQTNLIIESMASSGFGQITYRPSKNLSNTPGSVIRMSPGRLPRNSKCSDSLSNQSSVDAETAL